MEFLSIPFVVCLVLTFVLYYMRTGRRWQHGVLLLASCVFIGYYHLVYLLFALGITLLTFYAGLWLHRKRDTRLLRGYSAVRWVRSSASGSWPATGRRSSRWAFRSILFRPCPI